MAMLVYYVAGPYSAEDSWEREQNIRRAEAVAHDLMMHAAERGEQIAVICVHTMARYWYGSVGEKAAIAADMELLRRSDAVVLAPGWEFSKGTQAEIREAARACKPIFASFSAVVRGCPSEPEELIECFDEGDGWG